MAHSTQKQTFPMAELRGLAVEYVVPIPKKHTTGSRKSWLGPILDKAQG